MYARPQHTLVAMIAGPYSYIFHPPPLCTAAAMGTTGPPLEERCVGAVSYVFVHCVGIDHFKVSAPNLESLCFQATSVFKTICFENVPKLTDVTICTMDTEADHSAKSSTLLEFLSSLPKLTRLSVNGKFLKFLAGDTLPQELPTAAEALMYLKLNSLDFANFDEISCALCLIRNSPNLKELHIKACIP
ncbi:uncharacterized protein LOC131301368 isoform X2 [Rhododendron vialii]|uniref:uncharacterized protein LOC131301368 isoform X2 n=1 Tax=Rhododendron vialii TaxID=182163 RepID=UPI00265FB6A8|nr:uncharacterized protein LOC131301368 isoform X2 [Rhododendron vialii]